MICSHCGNAVPEGAVVCPQCGAQMTVRSRDTGVAARRQGRPDRPREGRLGSNLRADTQLPGPNEAYAMPRRAGSEGMRPVSMKTGAQPVQIGSKPAARERQLKRRPGRKPMINWAMLGLVGLIVAFVLLVGAFGFLRFTDRGQLILARMGRDANATAMWTYGQELLDQGYLDRSVAAFEKAYEMEPDREDIYDRLFQLADAYEAAGRPADAERVYVKLYTDIAEDDSAVYTQVARLMESQGRLMELSALLKTAYEKTGDSHFNRQRDELLPSPPPPARKPAPSNTSRTWS